MKLAFIEDSESDYALFERVFRRCGTLIHWVTAEDALDAFDRGLVDLSALDALIVDLHLPGIDGVEFVRAARSRPGGQSLAVCMLTSSASPHDIERATKAGADGYLVKPEDLSGLRRLPERVAEIAAAR